MADNDDAADIQLTDSVNAYDNDKVPIEHSESPSQAEDARQSHAAKRKRRPSDRGKAVAVSLAALLVITGLGARFEYLIRQDQQVEQQRDLFLQIAREAALNLTTIDYARVQADIQRVLDTSTGPFYDDFRTRSTAFADFVTKSQSKTQGTVTESGIESITGDSARVLVAVSVNVSNIGATKQEPRNWRMRIDVRRNGDTVKLSNVGFVV